MTQSWLVEWTDPDSGEYDCERFDSQTSAWQFYNELKDAGIQPGIEEATHEHEL